MIPISEIEKKIKKLEKQRNAALGRFDVIGAGQISKELIRLKELLPK